MANIDDILEQCLQRVASGRATVDDCLKDHPQHADVLRPLLRTALEIHQLDRPRASSEAFQLGRHLMMEAAAQRGRDHAASEVAPSEPSGWLSRLLRPKGPADAAWGKLAAVGVLGVATVLVWVVAAGLLLRAWRSVLVPQTCVVAYADGIAQVQAYPQAAWQPLVTGQVLGPGNRIRTGDPSDVTIRFFDGDTTSVGPDAELLISQLGRRRDGNGAVVVLEQLSGSTYNRVESQTDSGTLFRVETVSASVIVHGTEFKVRMGLDYSTSVIVLDGVVAVTGGEATVTLTRGQMTTVEVDQAPGTVVSAPAEELVERPLGLETPQPPEAMGASGPDETASPDATPAEPMATTTVGGQVPTPGGPETPPSSVVSPESTPEPTGVSTPASSPSAEPTATPKPPTPTATRKPPTPTPTPKPPNPTTTPEPPTPTATAVPSPTSPPAEVVEIYQAIYNEGKKELQVKARTSLPGCTLRLVGFGTMVAEGDHWVYVEGLDEEDVPSTVTVRSSCGGSDTSPVS
jgi:hypothetical protein